jgi:hypothetical protein
VDRSDHNDKIWAISPLIGKVVRLESDQSFHTSLPICLMALYLDPARNKKVEGILMDFLKWLNSQGPEIIPAE